MATALEVGDWSAVTPEVLRALSGDPNYWPLASIDLALVASMRWQARADVERAADCLHEAAGGLPDRYRRRERRSSGARWLANLTPPPGCDPTRIEWLIWRTVRVIVREQAGLAEHEAAVHAGRLSQRELLEIACGEYLRWVECDPFLPGTGSAFAGIDTEARCTTMVRRATNLRRLSDPAAPDIGTAIWRGARGAAHLKAGAYVRLARGELVPTRGPGALPPDVPVRCGRLEAYRRACQRRDDRRVRLTSHHSDGGL